MVGLRYSPKLMRAEITAMPKGKQQSVMPEVFVKILQSLETNEDAHFDSFQLERFLKSYGKHAPTSNLESLQDNASIDLDPNVFVNLWTARDEHVSAFMTALQNSKRLSCQQGYKLWVVAVDRAFHRAPASEKFKQLLATTNKNAVDHIVAGFVKHPGPLESLFRQHVRSVLEINAFDSECQHTAADRLWLLVEERKWLEASRDYLVNKFDEPTNHRLLMVLADLRERGQQNLRDVHFEITFNLVHKILKAGPWAHDPVRLYEHLVWAAKHVSSADAKRITQVLSVYFQREFESLKDASPEPDLKPTGQSVLVKTVNDLRRAIAQRVERKAAKTMSKSAKRKNSQEISTLRQKLAKCFAVGAKVVIKDLVGATQLNGTGGIVSQEQNSQGHVGVKCNFDGKQKQIKLVNLDILPEKPQPKSLKSYLHSMKITLESFVRARGGAVGEEALTSDALYALENIAGACSDHDRLQVFVEWVRDPQSSCVGMVRNFLNQTKVEKRTYKALTTTYLQQSKRNSAVSSKRNSVVSPKRNSSVSPKRNSAVSSKRNSVVSSKRNSAVSPKRNSVVSSDDDVPDLVERSSSDYDDGYDIPNDIDSAHTKDTTTSVTAAFATESNSDDDLPVLISVSSSSDDDSSDDSSSSY